MYNQERYNKIINDFIDKIDYFINQEVNNSKVSLINHISSYIIKSGGKRLRPLITVISGKILNCSNDDELFKQAAMIEFIHTSTLLHDDVVDESNLRRGQKTANNVFGNAATILVGDFLYSRAFQLMVSPNNMKIMQLMANTTNIIATGEVIQLMNIGNVNITEEQYFNIINYKTATLFSSAAKIGAILGNATLEQEKIFEDLGMNLGVSFQIIDDILDYIGNKNKIGKNLGDDLSEGKVTLPLIYLMNGSDKKIATFVRESLQNHNKDNFLKIHDFIINSGALDYSRAKAKTILEKSISYLNLLPKNEYWELFYELIINSLSRVK